MGNKPKKRFRKDEYKKNKKLGELYRSDPDAVGISFSNWKKNKKLKIC